MREFLGIELAGQHGEIGVEGLGVPLAVVWGGVAGVAGQRGGAEHAAQPLPFGIIGDGHADPRALRARVAAVRAHVGMVVAVGPESSPGEAVFQQAVPDHRGQGFDGRHVDELPCAAELAVQQRHHGGVGGRRADRGIPVAHAGSERRSTGVADQRREPGERGEARRVAGLMT